MNHIQSPSTDDSAIEREIQSRGLTAPRVTPHDIEMNIASEHYFTAADGVHGLDQRGPRGEIPVSLCLLTFCVLVLGNGFTVTGESACASPENFDAAIGKKIARANAVQKIWPLMGYELRQTLHNATQPAQAPGLLQPHEQRVVDEASELGEKLTKLEAFIGTDKFNALPEETRTQLEFQSGHMTGYLATLKHRIAAFSPAEGSAA